MKVYLVFRYVDYEGDDFLAAFDTLEKANEQAIECLKAYDRKQGEVRTLNDGSIEAPFEYGYFYTRITEVK